MNIKSILAAAIIAPMTSTVGLAGGFDLSTPQQASLCAAKANDLVAVGKADQATAMGCFTDDAVLNVYAPGNPDPVMSSKGMPSPLVFVQGAFQQFDYVMTQHLLGNVYTSGDKVFSSVHATHVKKDGTIDIANAEWIDTVVKVGDEYKVAGRDAHLIMFGKYTPAPVLPQ